MNINTLFGIFYTWIGIDIPILKIIVQFIFLEKVWLKNTLPAYDLDICSKFCSFFMLS